MMPRKGERRGVTHVCPVCGKEFYLPPSLVGIRKTCGAKCFPTLKSQQMLGELNHQYGKRGSDRGAAYKGGRKIRNGYVEVLVGNNEYALEHRLVMANHLGRDLSSGEHVHHRNENTLDNRLENLELMSKGEHARLHRLANPNRRNSQTGQFSK